MPPFGVEPTPKLGLCQTRADHLRSRAEGQGGALAKVPPSNLAGCVWWQPPECRSPCIDPQPGPWTYVVIESEAAALELPGQIALQRKGESEAGLQGHQ